MKTIDQRSLTILSGLAFDGNKATITEQLDRKDYVVVNKCLEALGGAWTKKVKAHVFPSDARERIEQALLTGTYETARDTGWFPSPPAVVAQLEDLAEVKPTDFVLEPSAGEGAIAVALLKARVGDVLCVEQNQERFNILCKAIREAGESNFFDVNGAGAAVCYHADVNGAGAAVCYHADFLEWGLKYPIKPGFIAQITKVVMNPPFGGGREYKHVFKALGHLRPGGRLVSVMPAGVRFRQDKLPRLLHDMADDIIDLPDDAFKESGTMVRTSIVVVDVTHAKLECLKLEGL